MQKEKTKEVSVERAEKAKKEKKEKKKEAKLAKKEKKAQRKLESDEDDKLVPANKVEEKLAKKVSKKNVS